MKTEEANEADEAEAEPETPVEEPAAAEPAAEEPLPLSRSEEAPSAEHAEGDFSVPDGYAVLQGSAAGGRRAVGIVVSRFNGAVTSKLLEGALAELDSAGIARDAITVMPVRGHSSFRSRRWHWPRPPLCLHRRTRLRDPRRHAALRLRRG